MAFSLTHTQNTRTLLKLTACTQIYTDTNFPEHSYILDPVSGVLKLILNDAELEPNLPRAEIDFHIDRVAVTFRRAQYLTINSLVNYLTAYLRREPV